MQDLREIYQEVILDHSKKPRNFRRPEATNHHADGHNPLCGDRVSVFLDIEEGRVKDVGFVGKGCAICTASSSMMTEAVKGRTVEEAEAMFDRFHELLTVGHASVSEGGTDLGKLEVFAGVREYPVRVKCATLPWHTFHAALHDQGEAVSTE